MSLLDDAKKLIESVTGEVTDFSVPITITSPSNQVASLNGMYSDHTLTYDENGQAMNGEQAHVTIAEKHLTDQGYPTRNARGLIDLIGHKVTVPYVDGSAKVFIVDDMRPDYTINLILLFLSEHSYDGVAPLPPSCLPVTIFDKELTLLYEAASGSVAVIQNSTVTNSVGTVLLDILAQQNKELPDVVNTDSDGTPISTPAQVPFVCTPQIVCADGTVNVNNSDGDLIASVPVAAGGVESYNVSDSVAVLKNTLGTILSSTDILAEASEDIIAPDATYLVQYANGTLIQSGNIPSGESVTVNVPNVIICADANWELRDSLGVLLDSGTVASGGTVVITAPDTTVNVNGVGQGIVVAGSTLNVTTNVMPDSVSLVGDVLDLQFPASAPAISTATIMKTGQTTSYRTGDDGDIEAGRGDSFLVLAENNPFENTNRFTDELGGQTYTNNIVIDWSTFNGSTVLGYTKLMQAALIWDSAIETALTLSLGAFISGWRLWNRNEAANILNFGVTARFNYAPFNDSTAEAMWTSTTHTVTTQAYFLQKNSSQISEANKTAALKYKAVRTFTVTGITLS